MSNKPIITRPVTGNEKILLEKFHESIVGQDLLMDKLGERLLTLELGIPGLYATVIKFINGEKSTVNFDVALGVMIGCWMVALILTLIGITPRNWVVDSSILRQDPQKISDGIGIEDFFTQSAQYKRRFLIISAVIFFSGVVAAIFTRVTK